MSQPGGGRRFTGHPGQRPTGTYDPKAASPVLTHKSAIHGDGSLCLCGSSDRVHHQAPQLKGRRAQPPAQEALGK